jgi:zinc transport system permease protein
MNVTGSLLLAAFSGNVGASAPSRETLLAVGLASLLSGLVGTLVVLRRLVSLGGGIAHAAFGGVGLALVAGVDPRYGAATVAVVAAAALAPLNRQRLERQDALIGVLWAVGMATGMLLVAAATDDHQVEELLFGDLGAVKRSDLALLGGLVLAVALVLALFRRELAATAFDDEHARLRGLPVGWLAFLLLLLVALSVVALLALVGIVLAIALLAIPPLVALRLFRALPAIVAGATRAAGALALGGLAAAAKYELPAGPAIILAGGALLGLAQLAPRRAVR